MIKKLSTIIFIFLIFILAFNISLNAEAPYQQYEENGQNQDFEQSTETDPHNQDMIFEEKSLKAVVLEAETQSFEEGRLAYTQNLRVEITSSEFEGQILEMENNILKDSIYGETLLEENDRIVLSAFLENGELVEAHFQDYLRERGLIYLGIIALILLLIVAKKKGISTIIALLLTMAVIFFYLIPQIAEGAPPIRTAVLTALVLIIIIQGIIGGLKLKSLAAIIGTAAGVICAALLAYYFGHLVELSGLNSEEARMLLGAELNFDPKGILFAGIIIGSLGAVTDVAMSIASLAESTWKNNKNISFSKLYKIGLKVGRDIIGTMANTLILAYTGSSLALFILFYHFSSGWVELINMDLVATEIIRGLAGTVGLIITIPVTAFAAAILYKKKEK